MKLHLPKSLLGVLFAGLMASAAQAAEYSGSFSGASAQNPLPAFTFNPGATLTLTVDACDKAYKAGGSAHTGTLRPDANVGNGTPWTTSFTLTNTGTEDICIGSIALDAYAFNSGGNFHTSGDSNLRVVVFTFAGDSAHAGSTNHAFTGSGGLGVQSQCVLALTSPLVIGAGNSVSLDLAVQKAEGCVGTFVGLRGMSFTTHETFYWQGDSNHWSGPNWGISETASGTPVSLPDIRTAHAIFNNSGDTSTVMINGSVAVNRMTVSAGNYTFQGSNGTTATLGVTGDLNISATATLDKLSVSAGRITVENGGALNLAQSTLTADVTSHGTVCLGEGISRIDGTLMLGNDTLVLGHANAQLEATSLESAGSSLTLRIHDNTVLDAINAASRENPVTIISLENAYSGGAALQTASRSGVSNKYFTELRWENGGLNLVYTSEINHQYVNETVRAESANGEAGAELLQQAFETSNPQVTAPGSDLASVLDAVERGLVNDEVAAAVAGTSVATLGIALANDMERQLQAIRNRTTTMGVGGDAVVHTGMPYVNAWVNAEGNYSKLQKDGSAAGYTLNNWGGTVGLDVDVDPYLTVGCALSAMYGDYKTQGPDTIKGDLETCYFTAFARYTSSAWTHTFVASYGMMDASLDRSVSAGGTGYENTGNTEGTSVGLLYELGYVVALDDDASSCLQPVVNVMFRHSGIDAYTEDGGNAALDVDKQSMTTVTFGFGTRYQAVVGESMYNRTSILEARVLGKAHVGDRSCQADVAFTNTASGASVESAELGSLGVEAGIGLVIPVGDAGGSLFADASAEYNSGFLNANATLGYRINF